MPSPTLELSKRPLLPATTSERLDGHLVLGVLDAGRSSGGLVTVVATPFHLCLGMDPFGVVDIEHAESS